MWGRRCTVHARSRRSNDPARNPLYEFGSRRRRIAVDRLRNPLYELGSVAKSAAAKAGIEVGDIILMMGKVGIFSKDDIADGTALGVQGTPTFFVNGKQLDIKTYADLGAAIRNALGQQK